MRKLIAFLCVAVTVFSISACGKTNETTSKERITTTTTTTNTTTSKETTLNESNFQKNQIEINAVPTSDGTMCVFVTNNSETIVDYLSLQINYMDENNNIIDLEEDGHDMILPGKTVVSRLDTPDKYSSFDVEYKPEIGIYDYKNYSDEVDIKYNIGEDCIIVQITNNANVTIEEIEYVVVLYNDDTISYVSYGNDIYDIESGEKIIEKENIYQKEFNRVEVYLNQAHTF